MNTTTRRLILMVSIALAALCGSPAHADWKDLEGETAPEISADRWLNTGSRKPTSRSLRGRVWILEFFATWCDVCERARPELERVHAKYADRGLRVVAISDEPVSKLRKHLIDSGSVKFWIGSDPRNTTAARYSRGEVGIPQIYVVDATGVVVAQELPTDAELEKLLESAFDTKLRTDLDARLDNARVAYQAGRFGEATRLAAAFAKSTDPTLSADAAHVIERCRGRADVQRSELQRRLSKGRVKQVYADLVRFSAAAEGLRAGTWAQEKIDKLLERATFRKERDAWKALSKAVKQGFGARTASARTAARRAFAQVRAKYPDSKVAEIARAEMQRL